MSKDREIAEALADGINCLANLHQMIQASQSPSPDCLRELDTMEHALEAIRGGVVVTSFVADDGLMADVRGVRDLVSDLIVCGKSSSTLARQIEGLLKRFGITAAHLEAHP